MEWTDEALILSVRAHGETASIVELFTRDHGRHLGLVHGGRSRKKRPILQIGNHVEATWKARLADQLGQVNLELRRGYAAQVMDDAFALAGLTSMAALARLLPERDPHGALFEISMFLLSFLDDPDVWPALYVRWEIALLEELGYGLDLSACAATGTQDALIYVSPKSGRAVSASAGEPYADKLLNLPPFLRPERSAHTGVHDTIAGLALTEHFLQTRVLLPREQSMPEARRRLSELLRRTGSPAND